MFVPCLDTGKSRLSSNDSSKHIHDIRIQTSARKATSGSTVKGSSERRCLGRGESGRFQHIELKKTPKRSFRVNRDTPPPLANVFGSVTRGAHCFLRNSSRGDVVRLSSASFLWKCSQLMQQCAGDSTVVNHRRPTTARKHVETYATPACGGLAGCRMPALKSC
jgi:hypothetical protein